MNDPTTEWAPFDKTRATPSGPRSRKEKRRVAPLSALARYLRHSGVKLLEHCPSIRSADPPYSSFSNRANASSSFLLLTSVEAKTDMVSPSIVWSLVSQDTDRKW
jgi:hypothetical protein